MTISFSLSTHMMKILGNNLKRSIDNYYRLSYSKTFIHDRVIYSLSIINVWWLLELVFYGSFDYLCNDKRKMKKILPLHSILCTNEDYCWTSFQWWLNWSLRKIICRNLSPMDQSMNQSRNKFSSINDKIINIIYSSTNRTRISSCSFELRSFSSRRCLLTWHFVWNNNN